MDSLAKKFTQTVIVRQRINGWVQKITAVYRPNQRDRRAALWNEILEINDHYNLLWVIGGDFNVVIFLEEREGGS